MQTEGVEWKTQSTPAVTGTHNADIQLPLTLILGYQKQQVDHILNLGLRFGFEVSTRIKCSR